MENIVGKQASPDSGSIDSQPLRGLRVIELGSMAAGPFAGTLMGDFGAEVIKIEQLDGDPVRFLGEHYNGVSLYAKSIMRNKKVVCLNLASSEGQTLLKKLVKNADVVLENFRPQTLEKWGLGYEQLAAINPKVILTRVSGYGQSGPYSALPGYGAVSEGLGGLRHMTGDPDRPPARVAVALTDHIAAVYAAFATVMAVRHRERTGVGQCVDVALYEAAFSFMHPFVPYFEKLGKIGCRAGSRLPNMTPNNLYLTKDRKYYLIAAGNQPMFRRLAKLIEREDLIDDPKFSTEKARTKHENELDEIISRWVLQYDSADIRALLSDAGVVSGPIYTMEDIYKDPHYKAREMLKTVADEDFGSITLSGVVPKLSVTPGSIRWSGGDVGRHTDEVLKNELGLNEQELANLEALGVIRRYDSKLTSSHDAHKEQTN